MNLGELRKARGLTQAQVSTIVSGLGWNVTQQSIAKVERGTQALKLQQGFILACVYDVPLEVVVRAERLP